MAVDTSREDLSRLLYQARYCPTLIDADWREWEATLRALLARAEAAEREAYDLRLTLLGGEDAPGFAGSVPLEEIKDLHNKHLLTMHWRAEDLERRRDAATAERDRLAEALEAIADGEGDAQVIASQTLAALASTKKEPTDGE